MPKISIIIPTKNRYKYLNRAISSVFNQTMQDFELIIINDASTDETEEFINSLHDSRIVYIRLNKSVGCAEARNIGIRRASSEYLSFLDDDDEYLPFKLEVQLLFLERQKDSISVIYTDMLRVCKDGSMNYWVSPSVQGKTIINKNTKDFQGVSLCMQQIMIHKKCFDDVGMLCSENPNMEDVDFYVRLYKNYKFHHIPIPTVLYYDTGGVSYDNIKTIISRIMIINKNGTDFYNNPQDIDCQIDYLLFQINVICCNMYCDSTESFINNICSTRNPMIFKGSKKYPDLLRFLDIMFKIKSIKSSVERVKEFYKSSNLLVYNIKQFGYVYNDVLKLRKSQNINDSITSNMNFINFECSAGEMVEKFVSDKENVNLFNLIVYDSFQLIYCNWSIVEGNFNEVIRKLADVSKIIIWNTKECKLCVSFEVFCSLETNIALNVEGQANVGGEFVVNSKGFEKQSVIVDLKRGINTVFIKPQINNINTPVLFKNITYTTL